MCDFGFSKEFLDTKSIICKIKKLIISWTSSIFRMYKGVGNKK